MLLHILLRATRHLRHNVIFPTQLAFGIRLLRYWGNQHYCQQLQQSLAKLPEGTVGKTLWTMLAQQQLTLVPYYEKHDLKHAVLGYSTHPCDEMRMQAFMFGNAGFAPFVTLVFCAFIIWTPEVWHELPYHYRIGKKTPSIAAWRIEDLATYNLAALRQSIRLDPHVGVPHKFRADKMPAFCP